MESKELQAKDKKKLEVQGELTQTGPVFIPAVDIFENKNALILVADMPGVNNDAVDIHLKDNELMILGRVPEKRDDVTPISIEFEQGNYLRRFTLSNVIDQTKIEARMKDGVLRIVLPKAEPAIPRQITVKAT